MVVCVAKNKPKMSVAIIPPFLEDCKSGWVLFNEIVIFMKKGNLILQ